MLKFDKSRIGDLKEYLYQSNVHDAKITTINYESKKKILIIKLINPIYDNEITLNFEKVKVVLSISGKEFGSRETIISLSAEENYSYLQNCTNVCGNSLFDSIYLLFQMLSGDELHIISKYVLIEDIKKSNDR